MRRKDGYYLIKVCDGSYKIISVGKWMLFSDNGTCLGYSRFFDTPISAPPIKWADKKIKDYQWLVLFFL
jgi:hypothetical protein